MTPNPYSVSVKVVARYDSYLVLKVVRRKYGTFRSLLPLLLCAHIRARVPQFILRPPRTLWWEKRPYYDLKYWLHRCWWQNHYVIDFFRYVGDSLNVLNRSPTSQTWHQHIWSPTSVTNIDVTNILARSTAAFLITEYGEDEVRIVVPTNVSTEEYRK